MLLPLSACADSTVDPLCEDIFPKKMYNLMLHK